MRSFSPRWTTADAAKLAQPVCEPRRSRYSRLLRSCRLAASRSLHATQQALTAFADAIRDGAGIICLLLLPLLAAPALAGDLYEPGHKTPFCDEYSWAQEKNREWKMGPTYSCCLADCIITEHGLANLSAVEELEARYHILQTKLSRNKKERDALNESIDQLQSYIDQLKSVIVKLGGDISDMQIIKP